MPSPLSRDSGEGISFPHIGPLHPFADGYDNVRMARLTLLTALLLLPSLAACRAPWNPSVALAAAAASTTRHGVRVTIQLPAQTIGDDDRVLATVTVRNLSGHTVDLPGFPLTCAWVNPTLDVMTGAGTQVDISGGGIDIVSAEPGGYGNLTWHFTGANCPYPVGQPLRPGKSLWSELRVHLHGSWTERSLDGQVSLDPPHGGGTTYVRTPAIHLRRAAGGS